MNIYPVLDTVTKSFLSFSFKGGARNLHLKRMKEHKSDC